MAGCTRDEIRAWLEEGRRKGATHTVVCCDTFDSSYYPVHVSRGQDVRAVVREHTSEMNRVMEVYSLGLDLDAQLAEPRSHHFELPPESHNRSRLSDLAG